MSEDSIDAAFRASPLFRELERLAAEDDPSRFDTAAKRHHVIPQFLLTRFTRNRSRDGFLFQLDVRSGQPKKLRPKQVAVQRYFYAIESEEGVRHNRLEGFLSVVESHAAPAIERLLAQPGNSPTDGDKATLAFFVALLDSRTPGGTQRIEQSNSNLMRMLFTTQFADLERFIETYREVLEDEHASDEEIEAFRDGLIRDLAEGRVDFADPRAQAFNLGLPAAASIASIIFQMRWTLMICERGFVTSDRGLALHDPGPPYPWTSQTWASSPHVEATIPLSSDVCLLLHYDDPGYEAVEVDSATAELINLRTYGWATDYIFGCSQELVASVRAHAKKRPRDVVRPKPHHYVMLLDVDPSDTSLADANKRRGWPAYFRAEGKLHDYIVIGPNDNSVELTQRVNAIVEDRERRRLGLPDGVRPQGRPDVRPVRPLP